MPRYDAIVIGSGQAGSPLSQKLADRGWAVALVEKEHLGGTCVNTGCTPTKTMIASAQVAFYARNAGRWGVRAGAVTVDLPKVVARKDQVVGQSRAGLNRKVEERKTLHLYRGHARFIGSHEVRVGEDVLESERIFIDTGTRPDVPPLEGLRGIEFLDNASIMRLTEVPEHLLVLGGGYVGMEFGQMFRRFGSRVTVVQREQQILPHEDTDVAEALQQALEGEGLRFLLAATATRVEKEQGGVALSVEVGEPRKRCDATHLLVATGRRPNTDDLGLQEAGVQTDQRGFIRVNNRLETSVPGVSALGDVKGGPAFTHISFNDYQIVYANLVDGKALTTDNRPFPYAVFTDPQLGRVGLTEREARAEGRRLKGRQDPDGLGRPRHRARRDGRADEAPGRCRNGPHPRRGHPGLGGWRGRADSPRSHARGQPLHASEGGGLHPPDIGRGALDLDGSGYGGLTVGLQSIRH